MGFMDGYNAAVGRGTTQGFKATYLAQMARMTGTQGQGKKKLPPLSVSQPDDTTVMITSKDSPVTITVRHTSEGKLEAYPLEKK